MFEGIDFSKLELKCTIPHMELEACSGGIVLRLFNIGVLRRRELPDWVFIPNPPEHPPIPPITATTAADHLSIATQLILPKVDEFVEEFQRNMWVWVLSASGLRVAVMVGQRVVRVPSSDDEARALAVLIEESEMLYRKITHVRPALPEGWQWTEVDTHLYARQLSTGLMIQSTSTPSEFAALNALLFEYNRRKI
jgi:hypothetical protein